MVSFRVAVIINGSNLCYLTWGCKMAHFVKSVLASYNCVIEAFLLLFMRSITV